MTGLFAELMNFITGKGLRQEEAKRFQERYNRREQKQIVDALSGIRAYGGNLWSWLGSLATSCVSSYFSYQSAKSELREGLNDDLWQLKKEEIEDCNELQVKLLNSSWNLLRQYKLPDEYRLTQESLNGYYKAVNEADPSKRLRMLRARNVERNFQVYPPYWYYRAKAAQESGNDSEALSCWDKFAEVWRPVLRNDPYKLEEAKYRVQRLAANSEANREEIRRLLGVIQDNISAGDWSNNLFAGVAYFLMGDKDEGIACVEANIDFGYETDISNLVMRQFREGELKPANISDEIEQAELQPLIEAMTDKEVANAFVEWLKEDENGTKATETFERLAKTSNNRLVFDVLWFTKRCKTPSPALRDLYDEYPITYEAKGSKAIEPILRLYIEKGSRRAKLFRAWLGLGGSHYAYYKYDLPQIYSGELRQLIQPFAEEGHFYVEYMFANCQEYDSDGCTNRKKYLLLSAEKGYWEAQKEIAFMYYGGLYGEAKDYAKATEWYKKAAEQGDYKSAGKLAEAYYFGRGVEKNIPEAFMWDYLALLLFAVHSEAFVQNHSRNDYERNRNGEGLIFYLLDSFPYEGRRGYRASVGFGKPQKFILSFQEINSAIVEANRRYEEIKKRNGWK